MPRWTMTRRLIVSLVVLIGALWLIGVGIAAISMRHEIDEVFNSALQETAERLLPLALDEVEEHGERDKEDGRQLSDPFRAEGRKEYLHYQVRDAKGRVIVRSHDAPIEPFPAPLESGPFYEKGRRYFTVASPDAGVYVQVAELPGERQEAITALWIGLAAPLLGLLPIAALVIYLTVRRSTRPILEVQRQIGMRGGEHLEPIDPRGLPDELAPIIHDLNRLLERLRAALEAERSFAANSAHELRNPIAAARAQAELISASLQGGPEHARAAQLVATLGQLANRVEKMLQLARAEAGIGLARTKTDLLAITRLVVEDYAKRPQLASRLSLHAADRSLTAGIDPDALGIALHNLIDNALSHGSVGGPIAITVGPGATISVVNDGVAVEPDELARLKTRFERGGRRTASGSGLGLAIVEEIMRQAGGRLELFSPARGKASGFEAVLNFPAMPEAAAG
jgi:two-component system OmpR family sensor kinase